MNLNMKFYVISIVAIFAALGIGIYIGFTLDAQSFVLDQREDIAAKLEERFDFLKSENDDLKSEISNLENINKHNKIYIENTYESLVHSKLKDRNLAIIETNDDYMYSSIGKTISEAGGSLQAFITIKTKVFDKEDLEKFYRENQLVEEQDFSKDIVVKISQALLDQDKDFLTKLKEENFIEFRGSLEKSIDSVILAGGSLKENNDTIGLVDKSIVDFMKSKEIQLVGLEKVGVNNSYMENYKSYKISTIDNIDTVEGKVALVFALNGYPGNYGIKSTAESLVPDINPKGSNLEKELIDENIKSEEHEND